MGMLYLLLLLAALVIVAIAVKRKDQAQPRGGTGLTTKKAALTHREQAMYFRLREVLSGHIVLAQVAFSALLKTKNRADRSRFDRKVADFVILDKSFEVLAIIELDDASHRGKDEKDAARQSLLTNAGYRVVRYGNVPDRVTLEKDFNVAPPPTTCEPAISAQAST